MSTEVQTLADDEDKKILLIYPDQIVGITVADLAKIIRREFSEHEDGVRMTTTWTGAIRCVLRRSTRPVLP